MIDEAASYKTAISRKTMSVPMRRLRKDGLLKGEILDYGCGRGKDVETLKREGFTAHGYDPTWAPNDNYKYLHDTVTCNYVLNVVNETTQRDILTKIGYALRDEGTAYITVRRDIGNTKTQRHVELPYEVVYETSSYVTYKASRLRLV